MIPANGSVIENRRLHFIALHGKDGAHSWFLGAEFVPDLAKVCLVIFDPNTQGAGGDCWWIMGTPHTSDAPRKRVRRSGYAIEPVPWAKWPQQDRRNPLYIYGTVAASIQSVRVRTNTGKDITRATVSTKESFGLRFFAIPLGRFSTGSVQAMDAAGHIIETQHFYGNPTIGPGTLCDPAVPSCHD